MATKGKAKSAAATTFASGSAPTFASGPLRLPGPRGPWTWCISASRPVEFRRGRTMPDVVKAWHEAGIGGNTLGGRGAALVAHFATTQGAVPIPHDRTVVAFGVEITGADLTGDEPSTYLHRWEGVSPEGRPVVRWTDAWERPSAIGWEFDHDGRDEWLAGCLELIWPDGVPQAVIAQAAAHVIHRCELLHDRDQNPRALRLLRETVAHLPPDLVPHEFRQQGA